MITLHPSSVTLTPDPRVDKPECCINVAKGHCAQHCPRIEDVLYSQRKGKTNKGAQRWRCKICGTKWTSKQTPIPPVVPDTNAMSIGYGNGPEEISMDMRAVTRPYKKSRLIGEGITSPFPTTMYSGNSSPSQSPIPSPPSPVSSLYASTVPNSRTVNQPNNNGTPTTASNGGTPQNFLQILPTILRPNQNQSPLPSLSAATNGNSGANTTPLSASKMSLTTKPVVVSMSPQTTPTPSNPIMNRSIDTSKTLIPIPNTLQSISSNSNSNTPPPTRESSTPQPGGNNANRIVPLGRPLKSAQTNTPPQPITTASGTVIHPPLSPKSQKLANLFQSYMAAHPGAGMNTPKHGNFKANKSSPQPKVPSVSSQSSAGVRGVPDYQSPSQNLPSTPSPSQHPQQQYIKNEFSEGYGSDHHQQQYHVPQQQQQQQQQQQHSSNQHMVPMSMYNQHYILPNYLQSQTYTPSVNMIECMKRILSSISIFIGEFGVDTRIKLNSLLNYVNMPSTESLFGLTLCKNLLSYIDKSCFKVCKHYQSMYSVITRHLSMMEDPLQPLTKVYFDESEINRFMVFMDQSKIIDDIFENILSEAQSLRDTLVQKKESIEGTILDPFSNINSPNPNSPSSGQSVEQTKQESSRILDTLGPLESTLSNIEVKLRHTQKEINAVTKIFSIVEAVYGAHIQYHQPIIEKHSKTIQNFIVDVIQQTLYNADVLSASYNKMKITLAQNAITLGKRPRDDDELALIDTNNPFANTLNDVLSKFDRSNSVQQQQQTQQQLQQYITQQNAAASLLNHTPSQYIQPKERKVLAIYHTLCLDHNVPDEHPESPKRLSSVISAINELYKSYPDRIIIKNDPEEVSDKWILTVHSPEYLKQLDELTEKLDVNEIKALNAPENENNNSNNNSSSSSTGNSNNSSSSINNNENIDKDDENITMMDTSKDDENNENSNSNANENSNNTMMMNCGGECEDGDTFVSKLSLKAAKRSAGATLAAIDQVMKGKVSSAFVAARPPGHHAGRDGLTSGTSSQGFCLLNNICIGAKYAQLRYNMERIAIIDIDVHHGNGTEEIVANDSGFLFCSIHMFEEGFYPGSGAASSSINTNDYSENPQPNPEIKLNTNISTNNNIVNIPLDPKSSAQSFLKAFSIIIDKLNEYQPELLMISCGFDAHMDDHLASLCLSEDNYIEITKQLRQVADKWCKGRIISVLEGGYNINALKQCTIAHLMTLYED